MSLDEIQFKKKENRAQIFQSFDSLKGFKEMIKECEVEIVSLEFYRRMIMKS